MRLRLIMIAPCSVTISSATIAGFPPIVEGMPQRWRVLMIAHITNTSNFASCRRHVKSMRDFMMPYVTAGVYTRMPVIGDIASPNGVVCGTRQLRRVLMIAHCAKPRCGTSCRRYIVSVRRMLIPFTAMNTCSPVALIVYRPFGAPIMPQRRIKHDMTNSTSLRSGAGCRRTRSMRSQSRGTVLTSGAIIGFRRVSCVARCYHKSANAYKVKHTICRHSRRIVGSVSRQAAPCGAIRTSEVVSRCALILHIGIKIVACAWYCRYGAIITFCTI